MRPRFSTLKKLGTEALDLWREGPQWSQRPLSRLQRFLHFWVLVGRSFSKNRCPVRASALAYATLLALIPMLAVVVSVTSTFLKKEGEHRIDEFIEHFVASMTPPGSVAITNAPPPEFSGANDDTAGAHESAAISNQSGDTNATSTAWAPSNATAEASVASTNKSLASNEEVIKARKDVARKINSFVQNTRSGTLGVTGGVLLIFAAIGMLSRIENTMNDIWGVARGRNWFMRIVLYWGVLTLAPLCVVAAVGLATGSHWEGPKHVLQTMPFFGTLAFKVAPVFVLFLTFAVFYMLMPNTKVRWQAACVGGLVGGALFHLNNMVSVVYVSRVVSYSKIYGGLALVPVFMVGLYFSWVILLFGAQVAYAFQNRRTYMEQKQVESINQRGREFVALRIMTTVGRRFLHGEPPQSIFEMGQELSVPTQLIQQIMQTLCAAHILVETAGADPSYLPARPLERITCHDILLAMRAAHGQELAARDEKSHQDVYGEFNRIQEAERHVAQSITLLALANRSPGHGALPE